MMDIRHADCFDFLPTVKDGSIDAVITDPPYEISRESGFAQGNNPEFDRLKVSMDFGEWDKNFVGMDDVIKHFYRVLKPHGTIIIFYDLWKLTTLADWMTAAGFKQLRFIEWVKTNPVPLNQSVNYLTNAREIALTGVKKSKPTFHGKYDNGIYSYPIAHGPDRIHPTQKPVELIKALVLKHTNANDTVLDCFLGSGTTAVACQETERNFTGCEKHKPYYDHCKGRVRQSLFT